MNAPHEIRLRGPWHLESQPPGDAAAGRGPVRTTVPGDWSDALGADYRGRVRYQRTFGAPSGLEAADRVELQVDDVDAWADIWLNGIQLTRMYHGQPSRIEIRALLQRRNTLVLEVEKPPEAAGNAGGVIGEVRLAIYSSKTGL